MASASASKITANEAKELQRVYDFLSNFAPKAALTAELKPKLERKQKIVSYQRNPEAVKLVDESGRELSSELIASELARLEEEIADLQGKIDAIKSQPDKKIRAKDLLEALSFLGKKVSKVCDMVSSNFLVFTWASRLTAAPATDVTAGRASSPMQREVVTHA